MAPGRSDRQPVRLGAPHPTKHCLCVRGQNAEPNLNELKDWLGQNNAVVMFVLLVVFASVLISDGLTGLLA